MNRSPRNPLRATALALCLAALAPATASAAGDANPYDYKKAFFKVTVDGVQRTTWSTKHVGTGGCDGSYTGSGTERVRFTSSAVKVQATHIKGLSTPILGVPNAHREPILKLRGTVARQGAIQHAGDGDGGCGGGVDQDPIAPDCGTKRFRGMKMPVSYKLAVKPKEQIDLRTEPIDDPFRRCPAGGYSFPSLMQSNNGELIRTDLPSDELFDEKLGKIIVIARGKEQETTGDGRWVTTVRWVVTFERIGGRKKRR
jgi:hypothetical protein